MNTSPYAPPQAKVSEVSGSPDLSKQSNEELREILAGPDLYLPEWVHAAAKELAARHAVPRYVTRLHCHGLDKNFAINRKFQLTGFDRFNMIFSDSRLRLFSGLIVCAQGLALLWDATFFLRYVQVSMSAFRPGMTYSMMYYCISMISHVFMIFFFYTLYRVLSHRKG